MYYRFSASNKNFVNRAKNRGREARYVIQFLEESTESVEKIRTVDIG